jgi:hypothetical protein
VVGTIGKSTGKSDWFEEKQREWIMKKAYFVLFFSMVFSFGNLMGQSNSPIIGYDKVAWGSTIQVVTQNYPSIREITAENASLGVREFEQNNISSSIKSRKFYFYQNKLYRVFVDYGDVENDVARAILERIVSVYGRFNDTEDATEADSTGAIKRYSFYRNYNRNLSVLLNWLEIYNKYNYFIGNVVGVVYFDPIIWDQIETAKRKEKSNKLDL